LSKQNTGIIKIELDSLPSHILYKTIEVFSVVKCLRKPAPSQPQELVMIADLTDPCFSTEPQECFVNLASLSTLATPWISGGDKL